MRALGCGAALAALRRLASEPFAVDAGLPVGRSCARRSRPGCSRAHGIPLDRALEVLPAVVLDDAGAEVLGHGRPVAVAIAADAALVGAGERSVVIRDAAGRALALGELRPGDGAGRALAAPQVVFPWAVREGRAA